MLDGISARPPLVPTRPTPTRPPRPAAPATMAGDRLLLATTPVPPPPGLWQRLVAWWQQLRKTPELAPVGAGQTRVAPALPYHTDTGQDQARTHYEHPTELLRDLLEGGRQAVRSYLAPGVLLARSTANGKPGIRELHAQDAAEQAISHEGLQRTATGWNLPAIASPDGRPLEALAFMPSMVFAPDEDSFPVRPDLDGDHATATDASAYQHGVIGGAQDLTASVSVARKGEYVVMTYAYYFVDNKFLNYHRTDSATVSVYLKPDQDGRLAPVYLYNSWHYGGRMTPWQDLQLDASGRPVVRVERGSHALHVYGRHEALPQHGLMIHGDGHTSLDGRPLTQRLNLLTPQEQVTGATRLDLGQRRDRDVMEALYARYPERTHPIHPSLFQKLGGLK